MIAIPNNVFFINLTKNSFDVFWNESYGTIYDIVYELYIDDTLYVTTPNTSFFVDDLLPAQTYILKVRAKDASGAYSAFSDNLTVVTLTNPVTNLLFNCSNTDTIGDVVKTKFYFDSVLGADKYVIAAQRYHDGEFHELISKMYTKEQKISDPMYLDLVEGVSYRFIVYAINQAGYESEKNITDVFFADKRKPSSPNTLILSGLSSDGFSFIWKNGIDNLGIKQQNIYFNSILVGVVGASNTSYTVSDLPLTPMIYNVSVTSVDFFNNESEIEDVMYVPMNVSNISNKYEEIMWDYDLDGTQKSFIQEKSIDSEYSINSYSNKINYSTSVVNLSASDKVITKRVLNEYVFLKIESDVVGSYKSTIHSTNEDFEFAISQEKSINYFFDNDFDFEVDESSDKVTVFSTDTHYSVSSSLFKANVFAYMEPANQPFSVGQIQGLRVLNNTLVLEEFNPQDVLEDFQDEIYEFNFKGDWEREYWDSERGFVYRSKQVSDAKKSKVMFEFFLPINAVGATISFDYFVSSQLSNDYFIILIDSNRVFTSGDVGWQNTTEELLAGYHLIELIYLKDEKTSDFLDRSCIDSINIKYSFLKPYGYRVSPPITIPPIESLYVSKVEWENELPNGSSIEVECSFNNGASWTSMENKSIIPTYEYGNSYSAKTMLIRQKLRSTRDRSPVLKKFYLVIKDMM